MLSSNAFKFFLAFFMLTSQSCGLWRGKSDATAVNPPFVVEELKSEIPFSNKEPEAFQTEIVLLAAALEEKTFLARSGANRLIVFNYQTDAEISVLHLGNNQSFLVAPRRKVYAENERKYVEAKSASLNELLTAEWLNQKRDATFVSLQPENNLARYVVNLDESKNSEIIIYVDERIGLPVRQEFFRVSGEQKILTAALELRNFSLQPDAKLFEIPKDYRKLTAKEFREAMRGDRTK